MIYFLDLIYLFIQNFITVHIFMLVKVFEIIILRI